MALNKMMASMAVLGFHTLAALAKMLASSVLFWDFVEDPLKVYSVLMQR